MRQRWKLWTLAAGGVVVLVIGGLIIIKLVQGKAPAPLTLSNTTAGSGATAGTVDGIWKVSSGSQAGYRIKETLFGQSATAAGRTTAVTGSFTIDGTTVTSGDLSVDMSKVSSDRSQRDGQFRGRIMNVATYPTATFKVTQPIALSTLPADGVQVTAKATGDLTVHGTTRSVTFSLTAQRSGSKIQVTGSIPITFADYNISNPSGGPATTEDHGTLEFLINFTHS